MPEISVIMPVYNAEKYLAEAVDSILCQTYTDWELIIIDDGSTDESDTIIRSYSDSRIRYYRNDGNQGLITTLNKGISLCSGKYIARMDADDISMPERFQLQKDFLDSHPDCALCGSDAEVINEYESITGKILNLRSDDYLQVNLLFSVPFVHPSVMLRAEILKENLFDERYKHAEDYELWCRIADQYRLANLPSYLLKYRWHTTNVSVLNSQTQKKLKNDIICGQLCKIGLNPTDRELYLHTISFEQHNSKDKISVQTFDDFDGLNIWFRKIIEANYSRKRYNASALESYLWSRWIVLCISQKKYHKIIKPRFVRFNLDILIRTIKLVYFYSKK